VLPSVNEGEFKENAIPFVATDLNNSFWSNFDAILMIVLDKLTAR
jgi:hypothetical protein